MSKSLNGKKAGKGVIRSLRSKSNRSAEAVRWWTSETSGRWLWNSARVVIGSGGKNDYKYSKIDTFSFVYFHFSKMVMGC